MSSDEESPYAAPLKLGLRRRQQINNDKTNEDCFLSCEIFTQEKKENPNLSYVQFLDLDVMDSIFSGTNSQKMLFRNYLKRHRYILLKQARVKCVKVHKIASVESKLVMYLNLRAKNYHKGKWGVSWKII